MSRLLKACLVSVIALTVLLAVNPAPASARVFVGGFYGPGFYGPGWGWGGGPGWYGAAWGGPYGYYYRPHGTVKIDTHNKAAAVYIDGGYAGTVAEIHKFNLRPGVHDLSVRAPNGQTLYNQRVQILNGRTTKIHLGA
ncbi:MAG TPA: PEGA domain-containing protein [Bryobacteraceae bacterium]|nr:PEGA domain-containing protein [Bryobacteraceae bacterium]